jgi:hypothetical protein
MNDELTTVIENPIVNLITTDPMEVVSAVFSNHTDKNSIYNDQHNIERRVNDNYICLDDFNGLVFL